MIYLLNNEHNKMGPTPITPQCDDDRGNILFPYYNLNGSNYIPGKVIFERIIDWDLNEIDDVKTLSQFKLIFNWYIESMKPPSKWKLQQRIRSVDGVWHDERKTVLDGTNNVEYKFSRRKTNGGFGKDDGTYGEDYDLSKYIGVNYSNYLMCDINYIYISLRRFRYKNYYKESTTENSIEANPFETGNYDEIAQIKIPTDKIPTHKDESDLYTKRGYGNGFLQMISGGKKENTFFKILKKDITNNKFDISNDIQDSYITWIEKDWDSKMDESYYFTVINNKTPLKYENVVSNDGYCELSIISTTSNSWSPKVITSKNDSIKVFNRDVWWVKHIKPKSNAPAQNNDVVYKNTKNTNYTLIAASAETKYKSSYSSNLEISDNNNIIKIKKDAFYNLSLDLKIYTQVSRRENNGTTEYIYTGGQKHAEYYRDTTGSKTVYTLNSLTQTNKISGYCDSSGNYIEPYAGSTKWYSSILDTIDTDPGISCLKYKIVLYKSNGDVIASSGERSSYSFEDRTISTSKNNFEQFIFSFSNINLPIGDYYMKIHWRRNHPFLIGPQSDINKPWLYALNSEKFTSSNGPSKGNLDTYGDKNFQAYISSNTTNPITLKINEVLPPPEKSGDLLVHHLRPIVYGMGREKDTDDKNIFTYNYYSYLHAFYYLRNGHEVEDDLRNWSTNNLPGAGSGYRFGKVNPYIYCLDDKYISLLNKYKNSGEFLQRKPIKSSPFTQIRLNPITLKKNPDVIYYNNFANKDLSFDYSPMNGGNVAAEIIDDYRLYGFDDIIPSHSNRYCRPIEMNFKPWFKNNLSRVWYNMDTVNGNLNERFWKFPDNFNTSEKYKEFWETMLDRGDQFFGGDDESDMNLWNKSFYSTRYDWKTNIGSNKYTDPGLVPQSEWNVAFSKINSYKYWNFIDELNFLPTFDISDAYIPEHFFKTYGIYTQPYIANASTGLRSVENSGLNFLNLRYSDTSNTDLSIILGKHFAVFKCNILKPDITYDILPADGDKNFTEIDNYNSGLIIYTKDSNNNIVRKNNDIGYNINSSLKSKININDYLSFHFKIWLIKSSYLDYLLTPDINYIPTEKINNIDYATNINPDSIGRVKNPKYLIWNNVDPLKGSGLIKNVYYLIKDNSDYVQNWKVDLFTEDLTKNYTFLKERGYFIPKLKSYTSLKGYIYTDKSGNKLPITEGISYGFSSLKNKNILSIFDDKIKEIYSSNKSLSKIDYYIVIETDNNKNLYSMINFNSSYFTDNINDAKLYSVIIQGEKVWSDPNPSKSGYWYQLYDSWEFKNSGLNVRSISTKNAPDLLEGWYPSTINNKDIYHPIHYYFNYIFEKNQNYLFRVRVKNYSNLTKSDLIFLTPWNKTNPSNNGINSFTKISGYTDFDVYYNIQSMPILSDKSNVSSLPYLDSYNKDLGKYKDKTYKPNVDYKYQNYEYFESRSNPQNPITILANGFFGLNSESLLSITIIKTWIIQGYSQYNQYFSNPTINSSEFYQDLTSTGWFLVNESNGSKNDTYKYIWYYRVSETNFPIGYANFEKFEKDESTIDKNYIKQNFISRYIDSDYFNISFLYEFKDSDGIDLILYYSLNDLLSEKNEIKRFNIHENKNYEFLSLPGNCYLTFKSKLIDDKKTQLNIISDIKIVNNYHKLNNSLTTLDKTDDFIYSSKVGIGDNYATQSIIEYKEIKTKVGNGRFLSGIWENGTWLNGWRDSTSHNFLSVIDFYNTGDNRWVFTIYGNSSIEFKQGDKVSISNIVAIDINSNRRLLKNYFTIIDISDNTITSELYYDFKIMSIEKDSLNHFIVVSKNIWLNGLFLNGVFNGNWNDGTFRGYPYITSMIDSHWIDGTFDGGHFKSSIISSTASIFIPEMTNIDVYCKIKYDNNNLEEGESFDFSFGTYSKYDVELTNINDINYFEINILKNDVDLNNYINNNNNIKKITNYLDISDNDGYLFNIQLTTKKKSGLIQNFTFYDNNISKNVVSDIKNLSNLNSKFLFSYNSWMDLVYENYTATNLLKPQTLIDNTNYFYSENNLYGYITTDVLSSTSKFRDSFSNKIREYKLGVKWKIYHDYIGDSSYFDDYLHSIYTPKRVSELGWDWSVSPVTFLSTTSSFIFNRSDEKDQYVTGKELIITAQGDGGILNLQNKSYQSDLIPNRYNEVIKPLGYSMVSFDLVSDNKDSKYYEYSKIKKGDGTEINTLLSQTFSQPILNFSNINTTKIILNSNSISSTQSVPMYYLPVYENIDHLKTKNKSKVEYFFNKRDLLLKLTGMGKYGESKSSIIIDNIKFYELDMIPFFQYLNYNNVNNSIQIPNGIDYIKKNKLTTTTYTPLTISIINYKDKSSGTINNGNNGNIGNWNIDINNWTDLNNQQNQTFFEDSQLDALNRYRFKYP
jgi:hypothetical protein